MAFETTNSFAGKNPLDRATGVEALANRTTAVARQVADLMREPLEGVHVLGHFIAVTIPTPEGRATYTDARYWLRVLSPLEDLGAADLVDLKQDLKLPQPLQVITATNLAELTCTDDTGAVISSTHGLADYTVVHVYAAAAGGNRGVVYFFHFGTGAAPYRNHDVFDGVTLSGSALTFSTYNDSTGAVGTPKILTVYDNITVVTAVQFNTSTGTLQVKTRTLTVLLASGESGWADISASYKDC